MTNYSPEISTTNSILTQNKIEIKKNNIAPIEEKAIQWRILSSKKTEVFEIYSDGTEAKVSGSIEGINGSISHKKVIARKFKFEDILPSFHKAYKEKHDPLKIVSGEEAIAYRIIHSHSVEIEELYDNGWLANLGINPPADLSIGGKYEKIKGRKFCCSGQIIIPEPPPLLTHGASTSIPLPPKRKENKLLSDSLYGLAGLIVLALIATMLIWYS